MNATINNNLPTLSNEGGLSVYLEQIKKFPMLDAEEEYMLAKNWKNNGNVKAAEKLIKEMFRWKKFQKVKSGSVVISPLLPWWDVITSGLRGP